MGGKSAADRYRILDELLAAQRRGDVERVAELAKAWQKALKGRPVTSSTQQRNGP